MAIGVKGTGLARGVGTSTKEAASGAAKGAVGAVASSAEQAPVAARFEASLREPASAASASSAAEVRHFGARALEATAAVDEAFTRSRGALSRSARHLEQKAVTAPTVESKRAWLDLSLRGHLRAALAGQEGAQRRAARVAEQLAELASSPGDVKVLRQLMHLLDGDLAAARKLGGAAELANASADWLRPSPRSQRARRAQGLALAERLFEERPAVTSPPPGFRRSVERLEQKERALTEAGGLPVDAARVARAAVEPVSVSSAELSSRWAELSSLLSQGEGRGPKALSEVHDALTSLGFSATGASRTVWRHGDVSVTVRPMALSAGPAFKVSMLPRGGRSTVETRAVFVDGLRFEGRDWELFDRGARSVFDRVVEARQTGSGLRRTVRDNDGLRRLVSRGRANRAEKLSRLRELNALSLQVKAELGRLAHEGKLPRGVYIMVDGVDAASKTTNGLRISRLFESQGYGASWRSFKAPTAEERAQHWLARFDAQRPGEKQVFLADRSPLGDHAYNPASTADDAVAKAAELDALERELASEGVLVLKYLFYPGKGDGSAEALPELWRPMRTFGKREARAQVAEDLYLRQRARGVPEAELEELKAATMGPGWSDLKSFHDGVHAHGRFREMADAASPERPWVVVHTEDRHAGRVKVLQTLLEKLQSM